MDPNQYPSDEFWGNHQIQDSQVDGSYYIPEMGSEPVPDYQMPYFHPNMNASAPRGNGMYQTSSQQNFQQHPQQTLPQIPTTTIHDSLEPSVPAEEISYAKLLWRCLVETPGHTLPLKSIYDWVASHSDKASAGGNGWQNTIRHNLSLNQGFMKIDVGEGGGVKSHWTLTPEALVHGIQSTTLYREKDAKLRRARGRVERSRSGRVVKRISESLSGKSPTGTFANNIGHMHGCCYNSSNVTFYPHGACHNAAQMQTRASVSPRAVQCTPSPAGFTRPQHMANRAYSTQEFGQSNTSWNDVGDWASSVEPSMISPASNGFFTEQPTQIDPTLMTDPLSQPNFQTDVDPTLLEPFWNLPLSTDIMGNGANLYNYM